MNAQYERRSHRSTRAKGERGESIALEYLEHRGLRIIERNYRFERSEIDLIMEDGDELVFVEVKARHSTRFGEPEDSVTPLKQRRIRRVAEGYLFERGVEGRTCRFDVIAIHWNGARASLKHYINAFA